MTLPVWISLALLLLALTAGAVFVFLRVRAFWRDLKTLGSALERTLAGLLASTDRLAAGGETVGAVLPRLEAHVSRLQLSLARLAVLRTAVQDVRDGVQAFVPRK